MRLRWRVLKLRSSVLISVGLVPAGSTTGPPPTKPPYSITLRPAGPDGSRDCVAQLASRCSRPGQPDGEQWFSAPRFRWPVAGPAGTSPTETRSIAEDSATMTVSGATSKLARQASMRPLIIRAKNLSKNNSVFCRAITIPSRRRSDGTNRDVILGQALSVRRCVSRWPPFFVSLRPKVSVRFADFRQCGQTCGLVVRCSVRRFSTRIE